MIEEEEKIKNSNNKAEYYGNPKRIRNRGKRRKNLTKR
jgi:hypothetical protein